jgi:hypothetical protein
VNYSDGQVIEPGDSVLLDGVDHGRVVASIDTGRHLPEHDCWAYLGEGIMVGTAFGRQTVAPELRRRALRRQPLHGEVEVRDFIATAHRRPDVELLQMAESLLNSHWEACDARFNGRPMPSHLNIGIVQERHHGINWVIGYEGLPWDEVTTDT